MTYLGLTACATVNMAPNSPQTHATTIYPMPMNEFLPPSEVPVDRRIDLVPLYMSTRNPMILSQAPSEASAQAYGHK